MDKDAPIFQENLSKKYKILMVEDNLIVIKITKLILEDLGYDVIIAHDAKEALEHFDKTYDLVLLDIGLPGDISGLDVSNKMREILKGKYVPIIAYTADITIENEQCLAAGINALLVKPASAELLKTAIQYWLETTNLKKNRRSK